MMNVKTKEMEEMREEGGEFMEMEKGGQNDWEGGMELCGSNKEESYGDAPVTTRSCKMKFTLFTPCTIEYPVLEQNESNLVAAKSNRSIETLNRFESCVSSLHDLLFAISRNPKVLGRCACNKTIIEGAKFHLRISLEGGGRRNSCGLRRTE